MNICFITSVHVSKYRGGVERVTSIISKELALRGYKIYQVSICKPFAQDELEDNQYVIPMENIETSENISFLRSFFAEKSIDVIVNQSERLPVLRLINLSKDNIPLICAYHGDPCWAIKGIIDNFDRWIINSNSFERVIKAPYFFLRKCFQLYSRTRSSRYFLKNLFESGSAIVLLSEHFKKNFMDLAGAKDDKKIYAISNPIEKFNFENKTAKKEKIVLFVARLEYSPKRLDRLLRIWSKIDNSGNWQLYVLGDGTERKTLENYCVSLNIKNVHFEGTVNPESYYDRAQIFCLTSTAEGFGLVLNEALQHEVIPIAFNSYEAISDIIEDKYNGFLIRPFSEKLYRKKLEELMYNDDLRNQIRNNIRKTDLRSKFALANITDQWENLFKKVISDK